MKRGLSALFVLWILFFSGCRSKEPVKIGFSSWISGTNAVLGIAGRDSAELAVDQINENGGINGHPVELIVKDDQGDPEIANKVDLELIEDGCVAILGHMHSSMSLAVLPLINEKEVLMISPTASSDQLSGKKDYFYRIAPLSNKEIESLANYAFNTLQLTRISIITDAANPGFADSWLRGFGEIAEESGHPILHHHSFHSAEENSFSDLADEILSYSPDGVLFVSNSLNTALICQQLYQKKADLSLLSTGWANSLDFVGNGGDAVEGVIFAQARDLSSSQQDYVQFKNNFTRRYNREPDIASIYAYEAASVLLESLRLQKKKETLVQVLQRQQTFQGLQGAIEFDEFGENQQKNYFILEIRGGVLQAVP